MTSSTKNHAKSRTKFRSTTLKKAFVSPALFNRFHFCFQCWIFHNCLHHQWKKTYQSVNMCSFDKQCKLKKRVTHNSGLSIWSSPAQRRPKTFVSPALLNWFQYCFQCWIAHNFLHYLIKRRINQLIFVAFTSSTNLKKQSRKIAY